MAEASAAEAARSLTDLSGPWQLFVDDHLVAENGNVVRTFHAFEKHAGNPVLRADRPWEGTCVYLYGAVLPEESGDGYRMWYHALPGDEDYYRLLYATSKDGVRWEKPALGAVDLKGSTANNVFIRRGKRDHIPTLIHAPWETDPARRYQMVNYDGEANGYVVSFSPDGLKWKDPPGNPVFRQGGDVSQFLWDPHTKQYVGYVKNLAYVSGMRRRAVARTVSPDLMTWSDPELVLMPDTFDDRWAKGVQRTNFYGLSAFAYESMYIGFVWVFRATDNEGYFDGPVFVELVTSRDGVHWLRQEGDRAPVLPAGPKGTWDQGMVTTAQAVLVEGGELKLYYGGFDNSHAAPFPWHGAIGLATMRKDGFASLDAGGKEGSVLTVPLRGAAGALRVNAETAEGGSVLVEVLDQRGQVVPGYGRDACAALRGDQLDWQMTWGGKKTLPAGSNPIRLRFVLRDASLYSFAAGDRVKVVEELRPVKPAVLYTFEGGFEDSLVKDGKQRMTRHGDVRTTRDEAAFGKQALRMGSEFSPQQTIEIDETTRLGRGFTLACMAKSKDNRPARLFSAYDDHGLIETTELVFECDPAGACRPALRLICKGVQMDSGPARFDDGAFHHLAVTYDDGIVAFYVDGEPVGGGVMPGGDPVTLQRNLFVGEDSDLGRFEQFQGFMDDILVIGRALKPEDIRALKHKGAEAALSSGGGR